MKKMRKKKKMVSVKFKTNFSLATLAENADRLIEETMKEVGGATISSMQNIIKEAPYKPLTKIRKEQRGRNIGFPDTNKGVKNIGGSTPLFQSGSLYNSMKVGKKGVYMNHYGITHNDGVPDDIYPNLDPPKPKKVNMIKRPFIKIGLERTDLDEVEEIFQKKVDNYLRK